MKIQGHGKSKILTEEEFLLILAAVPQKYRLFFEVIYATGGRVSEICNVRYDDIVGNTLVLRKNNTKTKETREIPLNPELVRRIRATQTDKPYIFMGRKGLPTTRYCIHKILQDACNECGLVGISSHSFRRTALTEWSRNNISLRVIQKISGHRNLNVLQGYVDVSEEEIASACATRWSV